MVERAYNLHRPLIFDVNDEYPPVSCSCEIFLTIPFAAPHNFGFFGSPQSF